MLQLDPENPPGSLLRARTSVPSWWAATKTS